MPDYFAFVRNLKTSSGSNIKNIAQINSAEAHAKRLDLTAQARQVEGRDHADNYFWSVIGEGLDNGGADYAKAFRAHKKRHGASERKNAALAQHLLVGASPGWVAKAGDPRDRENPRVKALIAEAKDWAESWMGEGAVWAVRYDTDEKGAGVVDILASPMRQQHHKSGKSKLTISVRKANDELARKHELPNAFQAMQTDWAEWAQAHLDRCLQRGRPEAETKRKHVSPETYAGEAEKHRAEIEALRAEEARLKEEHELQQAAAEYYEERAELAAAEARERAARDREAAEKVEERQRDIETREQAVEAREAALSAAEANVEEVNQWVERGIKNLGVAIRRAEEGTHDQEITPEDMPDAPEQFAALNEAAPRSRPTFGFRARFWSLNYSDGSGPAPLPENIRDSLMRAFGRVAMWAGRIAKRAAALDVREKKVKEQEKQASERLEKAKAEATTLITKAQKDVQAMFGMAEALETVRQAPEGERQLYNNLTSLREAVTETLQQLGIARQRPDLGERDDKGDPPPVLELVFNRAERKTNEKNNELTARLGHSGPSIG